MFVFGYGSLMWDGWETEFGCTKTEEATLSGFRRDFNKASVQNWGSQQVPGPTLGLNASVGAECHGMAFEFPDTQRASVLDELGRREGASFTLEEKEITLASGTRVTAVVPINDPSRPTFIGDKSLEQRARLARAARGDKGSCVDYVEGIRDKLRELSVQDSTVERFARLVSE